MSKTWNKHAKSFGEMAASHLLVKTFKNPKTIRKYGPDYVPPSSRENHLPGHNFTGPGTRIKTRLKYDVKPMNAVDKITRLHDIDYMVISDALKSGNLSKHDAIKLVRKADKDCVRRIQHISKRELPRDDSAYWVSTAMSSKMLAEDSGVLDPLKFIISGVV